MLSSQSIFDIDLRRNPANCTPLTPIAFLRRSGRIFRDKVAIIDGDQAFTYGQFYARALCFARGLRARGIKGGDAVAVLAPNTHMVLEAHFGVPMAGAVLNALNTRLDAEAIAYMLIHSEAKLLIADESLADLARAAAAGLDIDVVIGAAEFEKLLDASTPVSEAETCFTPQDEWDAISINYTSGTTGRPKGAVYAHRGAYLNAMNNALALGFTPATTYLWTLPMFHCNGWAHPWAVTLVGGVHVCIPHVSPDIAFEAIERHQVTHFAAAPIVLNMLAHAPSRPLQPFTHSVIAATGGAPPPRPVLEAMEQLGVSVMHLYGQTESYGPSLICLEQEHWGDLAAADRAALRSRQGVAMPALEDVMVADPETLCPVAANGRALGEIVVRGNTIMKGYLKDAEASAAAFAGGWLHSGDIAVVHEDGYVEIKDRAKDIIISGGENISSVEVETILYRHPAVLEAAVVAKPDPKWGETPCAFVMLKPDAIDVDADVLIAWCRENLAHFKCPRHVVFGELPKTSTGKVRKVDLRRRAAES